MKRLLTMALLPVIVFCLGACGRMPDGEVDVTLNDVIEANSLNVLLEEHDNIYIKEDLVDINGYVLDTSYYYFAREDGQITCDMWHNTEESLTVINARNGAIYGLSGGQTNIDIIPENDYDSIIEKTYPVLPDPEVDEFQSAVKAEGEILVTTVRETFSDGSPSSGAEFRLDDRTLEINSVQLISYNDKGMKTGLTGFIVEYDSREKPDVSAWNSASQPEDGQFCSVTAVIRPGMSDEEERVLQVARGCNVEVAGSEGFSYYRDRKCKDPIFTVDTDSDSVMFYAKP